MFCGPGSKPHALGSRKFWRQSWKLKRGPRKTPWPEPPALWPRLRYWQVCGRLREEPQKKKPAEEKAGEEKASQEETSQGEAADEATSGSESQNSQQDTQPHDEPNGADEIQDLEGLRKAWGGLPSLPAGRIRRLNHRYEKAIAKLAPVSAEAVAEAASEDSA